MAVWWKGESEFWAGWAGVGVGWGGGAVGWGGGGVNPGGRENPLLSSPTFLNRAKGFQEGKPTYLSSGSVTSMQKEFEFVRSGLGLNPRLLHTPFSQTVSKGVEFISKATWSVKQTTPI